MKQLSTTFEVEVRLHLRSHDEGHQVLPFLRECLAQEKRWLTTFYGLDVFRSGKLLRIAEVDSGGETRQYLGWKDLDIGRFANIRPERDEEITSDIVYSDILEMLGGTPRVHGLQEAAAELERLGHRRFMSFSGRNLTGYYDPLKTAIKLMECHILEWPLLLEIERSAETAEAAYEHERELRALCCRLQLENRLVREEPPSLLYSGMYAENSGT